MKTIDPRNNHESGTLTLILTGKTIIVDIKAVKKESNVQVAVMIHSEKITKTVY